MKLTQHQLDILVAGFVPDEFQPQPDLNKPGYVRVYSVVTDEDMYKLTKNGPLKGKKLSGLTYSLGPLFLGLNSPKASQWKNRFNIYINENQSIEKAKFTLLHEVGHVNYVVNDIKLPKDKEVAADLYATELLSETYPFEEVIKIIEA